MKKLLSLLVFFLLALSLLPSAACAADENIESFNVTITAPYGNVFTLQNVRFGSNTIFDGDTTTFKHDLAIVSAVVTSKAGEENVGDFMTDTLGMQNVSVQDYSRRGLEEYRTGYAYGTKSILRDGKACTLLLIACSTSSVGDDYKNSFMADFDFMNYATTGADTNFDARQVLTLTEAAKLIYDGHDDPQKDIKDIVSGLKSSGQDYLVWVTGQSRGGSIGNYLSRLLVDECGTEHVTSYLISPLNVDKDAVTENDSRYNSIFNIVHPDDIVTYLPFGTGYGSGWGFARYGVDVVLHCAASASPDLDAAQDELYMEFIKNNDSDGAIYLATDKNYRYTGADGNGNAVRSVLANLANTFKKPSDIYNKGVTFNTSDSLLLSTSYSTVTKTLYGFVTETASGLKNGSVDYMSLYRLMKGTSKYSCQMQTPLNFLLYHFFGFEDFDDFNSKAWPTILSNINDLSQIKKFVAVREGGTAHFIDTYLSWLLSADETEDSDNFQTITYHVDTANAAFPFAEYDADGKVVAVRSETADGTQLTLSTDASAKSGKVFQFNANFVPTGEPILLED